MTESPDMRESFIDCAQIGNQYINTEIEFFIKSMFTLFINNEKQT